LIALGGCASSGVTLLKDKDVYYTSNGDTCFTPEAFERLIKRLNP